MPPQIAVLADVLIAHGIVSLPIVVVTTRSALVPVTPVGTELRCMCLADTDICTVPLAVALPTGFKTALVCVVRGWEVAGST